MNRTEHLEWAKKRSLEIDDAMQTWLSFVSDLSKHEELSKHVAIGLGNASLIVLGDIQYKSKVDKFIDGFN